MPSITRFSPLFRRAGASSAFKISQRSTVSSPFSTNTRTRAQMDSTSQKISETAKTEGGPSAGSTSAQMQSQVGKQQNFEQAAQEVGAKIQNDPASITSDDANYLKSREARATGQAQPPKESISAEAQRLASVNEQGTTANSGSAAGSSATSSSTGPLSPEQQSEVTKQMNFEEAAVAMADKMENDPGSVTKRDGDLMHRREQRALGQTEKGGIASQAQKLAAENEK